MIRIIPVFIALLLLPTSLLAVEQPINMNGQGPHLRGEGDRHDFVEFVKNNAHPLTGVEPNGKCGDLGFLNNLTAGAKIVALGASRHGSHEFMDLRRRIIECLVKHDGFTNILLEAGLPYTSVLNQYIHGSSAHAEKLVAGMTYWSIYQTKEFLGLLHWLREYNAKAKPGRKLNLLGIDMQDPRAGTQATLAYLKRVDPAFSKRLGGENSELGLFADSLNVAEMTQVYKHMPTQAYEGLSNELARIEKRFDTHRSAYIAKTGKPAYDWAREEFATVLEAHRVYSVIRKGTFEQLFEAREKALARNVEWQIKQGGDGGKYILLAHNNHIARSTIWTPEPKGKSFPFKPLGMSLSNAWPGRYVALATSYYGGKGEWHVWRSDAEGKLTVAPPGSLDAVLAASGGKLFFINLQDLVTDTPAGQWAAQRHVIRSEGSMVSLTPLSAYDGILFVRRLSQAHFTKAAIARLSDAGPPQPPVVHVKRSLLLKTQGVYRLSSRTRIRLKVDRDQLYVVWNGWKFKAFPVSNDEFELRVRPKLRFKVKRDPAGSVTSLQIQRGEHAWHKATIVH